jgi:plasmid maintenance system antidote protein VapI
MRPIPEITEPSLAADPLTNLIVRDSFGEIFGALNPTERLIAILRALTWSDEAIAEYLDLQPTSVNRIIQRARRRLLDTLPIESAVMLRGRRQPAHTRRRDHQPHADLSAYQAAQILDITPQRLTVLCRHGFFPNARRQLTPPHGWVIPARDLNTHLPRQGPPSVQERA